MKRFVPWASLFLVLVGSGSVPAQQKAELTDSERKAVEAIESAGGSVRQIAQNDNRIEVDFHLQGTTLAEESLAAVADLQNVVRLHLGNTNLTDRGMAYLEGLTTLTALHLEKTKITDAGLMHLKNLKNLSYLNLYGTAVTDAGLAHLKSLPKLEKLFLWQTEVTEAGVADLRKALPHLDLNTGWELDTVETTPEGAAEKHDAANK